jgi:hypothetical protein
MKKFWFEFDFVGVNNVPNGVDMGIGVTAFNYDDAISILNLKVFKTYRLPTIKKMTEAIDIATLDKQQILTATLPDNLRGVWYPLGYN